VARGEENKPVDSLARITPALGIILRDLLEKLLNLRRRDNISHNIKIPLANRPDLWNNSRTLKATGYND